MDCPHCEDTGYICTLCDLDEHRCECEEDCEEELALPDLRRCICSPRRCNTTKLPGSQ